MEEAINTLKADMSSTFSAQLADMSSTFSAQLASISRMFDERLEKFSDSLKRESQRLDAEIHAVHQRLSRAVGEPTDGQEALVAKVNNLYTMVQDLTSAIQKLQRAWSGLQQEDPAAAQQHPRRGIRGGADSTSHGDGIFDPKQHWAQHRAARNSAKVGGGYGVRTDP